MKKLLLGCSAFFVVGTTVAYGDSCSNLNLEAPAKNNLFNATLCVDGQIKQAGKNKAEDFFDQFQDSHLRELFQYDEKTSTGVFKLDFRGLSMTAAYPYPSHTQRPDETKDEGTLLEFQVPSMRIHKKFCPKGETDTNTCPSGGTRKESLEQLKEYLKKNGNQILTEGTKVSPYDSFRGNSTSLETLMMNDQFEAGTGSEFGDGTPAESSFPDGQLRPSLLGVDFRYGETQKIDGKTTKVTDMPFFFKKPLEGHNELIFRLPMSYTEVEGARTYLMMPSISYKASVLPNNSWFLTPTLGAGVVGSNDLWSGGIMVSTALTSDLLVLRRDNYSLSMGNMVGYYKAVSLDIAGFKTPDLSDTMVRNGLLLSIPLSQKLAGMNLMAEAYVTDTRVFGTALYERYHDEIGITIGPNKMTRAIANQSRQAFGIGLHYFRASHSHGFGVSAGYEF